MKKFFAFILICCFTLASAQEHTQNQKVFSKIKEAEKAAVVLNNTTGMIPVKDVKDVRIASVHYHFPHASVFDSIANKYWAVTDFNADTIENDAGFYALHDKLKLYNLVLIELSQETPFTPALSAFIKDVESVSKVIVILTGTGKNLSYLNNIKSPVIWNKTDNSESALVLAQVVFGGSQLPIVLMQIMQVISKGDMASRQVKIVWVIPCQKRYQLTVICYRELTLSFMQV